MQDFKTVAEFEEQVALYIRAGVQAVHIVVGGQAQACEQTLQDVSRKLQHQIAVWDCLGGWNGTGNFKNLTEAIQIITAVDRNAERPGSARSASQEDPFRENTYMIFRDPHYELLQVPEAVCALKLAIQKQALNTKAKRRPVFLITPSEAMNPDLVPYMKRLDYPKPDQNQRLQIFDGVRSSITSAAAKQCSDALRHQIAMAAAGLTATDAADALSESLIRHGGIKPEIIDTIETEKGRLLKKSEVLTYVPKHEIMKANELGGYAELKRWLAERALAYTPEAVEIGLDYPKGIVLAGVPGTGKSICADLIARTFALPRVTFHIDAVFNSLVGATEQRVRDAISTADALEGCVLLIDEADKALKGANEASGDSGVTQRVFGALLSWLASKKNRTFVVLTMNRVTGMPPELLRKGRFDEIFFVDSPDLNERRAILEIHLAKRRVPPATYSAKEWDDLLEATKGFVGAEIEEGVIAARFTAYAEDQSSRAVPKAAHLLKAFNELIPVTKMDPENIAAIREFGTKRARSVSTVAPAPGKGKRSQRNLDLDLPFPPPPSNS